MCGRGRLFPDTEQPPQNAPHAAGRTPHHDLHALTSCHASTPRRRRSAETPPETSGSPPETRRRSGCPAPAPARRSPETSFRRHIVARYIPPLLQYMKERTRRAWRGGTSRTPSPTRGSTYRPVGRGPRAPPENASPAAGHLGPALQVHTPTKNNAAPLAGRRAYAIDGQNIALLRPLRNRFRRNFHILDRCTKFCGELLRFWRRFVEGERIAAALRAAKQVPLGCASQ